ncbi:uncharacterized protein [Procambarus clarkii]|uniref:uncharacterized protein n=1 Tax=Procambarus clarkii TaxID=6728 RepID=UPI003742FE0F
MTCSTSTWHAPRLHDMLHVDMACSTSTWHAARLHGMLHFYLACSTSTWHAPRLHGMLHVYMLRKLTLKNLRSNQPRPHAHPQSSSTSQNPSHHQTALANSMSYASVPNASPHQQHHHHTAAEQTNPLQLSSLSHHLHLILLFRTFHLNDSCVQAAYLKAKDDGRNFADYLPIFLTHNSLPSVSVPPPQPLRYVPFSPTALTPQNTTTAAEENTIVPPEPPTNPILTDTENGTTDQTADPGLSQTDPPMSHVLSPSPNIVSSTSNLTSNTTTSDTSHLAPVNTPSATFHLPPAPVIPSILELLKKLDKRIKAPEKLAMANIWSVVGSEVGSVVGNVLLRKLTLKNLRSNQPRTHAHPQSSSTSQNPSHHQTALANSMSYASVPNASPHQQHHHHTAAQQTNPLQLSSLSHHLHLILLFRTFHLNDSCVQAAYLKAKDDGRNFADYLPVFLTHNSLPSVSVPPQPLRYVPFSPTALTPQNTTTAAEENTIVPREPPTNPILTDTENGTTDQTADPGLSQTDPPMSHVLSPSPNIVSSTSNLTSNTTTSDTSHLAPVNTPSATFHLPPAPVIPSVTLNVTRAHLITHCLSPTSRCKPPITHPSLLQDAPSSVTVKVIESRHPHVHHEHAQNPTSTSSKSQNS